MNNLPRFRYMLARLREERQPGRFLASRLLWRSGLCRMVTFDMHGSYRMRFHPSAISAALWLDQNFREEDTNVCATILREGDTYIDVGANVGQLAIVGARAVGRSGVVLAVEAHPRTCAFLRENVSLNGLPQLAVHNVALGEEEGQITFSDMACDDQNHVVGSSPDRAVSDLTVMMTTLDALWPMGRVRLLKIDAEGFELRILLGGKDLLARCDALYIEESAQNLARYGHTPQQVREVLQGAGFRLFAMEGTVLREGPDCLSGGQSQNLIAVRASSATEILASFAR